MIKTEIRERDSEFYPRLMKSKYTDLVVLFESEGVGTVLQGFAVTVAGYHDKGWDMSVFVDFNDILIISNGG